MFLKRYQKEFKLMKVMRLLCVCSCVALLNSWSSESEVDAAPVYDKYWHMAIKLHKQNRPVEAEKIFSDAINKNPNVARLYIMRAKFKQKYMSNLSAAILDYNMAEKLAPRSYPEIYWYRGMCLYGLQFYPQAIRDYSHALRMNPRWGKLYLYRAKAYAKLNMLKSAKSDLNSAIKYNPKYTQVAKDLWKNILAGKRDF